MIRAIESVLTQTYSRFEIIVVDDNEPESEERRNTEKMMERYKDDIRVHYFKHDKNRNGAAARNTAFKKSKGEYIAFLDDDDYFLSDKLKLQVEFLDKNKSFGGVYCWREQKGEKICGRYEGDLSKELLSLEFTPCTSSIMIRRECYIALNGFNESYRRHQDFEFLLRFFKIYSLSYVPKIQVVISTNGVDNVPKGKNMIKIKEQFFEEFKDIICQIKETDRATWKKIYLNHFVRLFKDLIRYGHPLLAIKIYFKYGFNLGFNFWKLFYRLCREGLLERRQKGKSKIDEK